jgi:hypothetical protein
MDIVFCSTLVSVFAGGVDGAALTITDRVLYGITVGDWYTRYG